MILRELGWVILVGLWWGVLGLKRCDDDVFCIELLLRKDGNFLWCNCLFKEFLKLVIKL